MHYLGCMIRQGINLWGSWWASQMQKGESCLKNGPEILDFSCIRYHLSRADAE